MTEQTNKQTVKDQLEKEVDRWQVKMDEAKLQMHLGAKEAQDKLQPHVEQLDHELGQAKAKLVELGKSSEGAWEEVKVGLESSFDVMKMAFESAQEHFTKNKK